MSQPFVGQVELFGFEFPPRNWATCSGQLIAKNQNLALFSLLGTLYGGDGANTFGLPDLRGRLPMGSGGPYPIGEKTGSETVALLGSQVATGHTHPPLTASDNADTTNNTNTPGGNMGLGVTTGSDKGGQAIAVPAYVLDATPAAKLAPTAVSQFGGQPHENRMPALVLNFCISLYGTFPSRN